ncbi:hypothetical protein ACHAXT_001140 [Thalassiosira profunda]
MPTARAAAALRRGAGPRAAICIGAAAAAAAAYAHKTRPPAEAERKRSDGGHLEMYLMDKIAQKPYLNYNSVQSSAQQDKRYRGRQSEGASAHATTDSSVDDGSSSRPRGVPSRLRILAIDVPQFKREAFKHGVCQLPSEIFDTDQPKFEDGVAPPKSMSKSSWHDGKRTHKPIAQKSLATGLYYCYDPKSSNKRAAAKPAKKPSSEVKGGVTEQVEKQQPPEIGVEVLEASVMGLNPNNIRRTYTSTNMRKLYRYDPGKYSEGIPHDEDASGVADADEAEVEEETLEKESNATEEQSVRREISEGSEFDDPDYERMAPWNQYAWLEEMHLRINGIVPFGAPMQRAHFLSQVLYSRIYKQSVPTSPSRGGWMSWLWWPVLWTGSHAIGGQRYRTSWDGADGEGENALYGASAESGGRRRWLPWTSSKAILNRASNKPHAVICDGAAMQRVPGSLRYLSKICRDSGIPLYIINDPRSWGAQTHSTLSTALVDMRKAVSDNVIRNALDLREGSAFERGRLVGQLEKEMAWQASDAARKTREALLDARQRLRKDKVEDWSDLAEDDLIHRLVERNVISRVETDEDEEASFTCSEAFGGICRRCSGRQKRNGECSSVEY